MNKFVWLSDDYCVNIDSIFSIQRLYIGESPEYSEWVNKYTDLYNEYYDSDEDIIIDGEKYSLEEINHNDDLSNQYYNQIHTKIIDQIGESPENIHAYEYSIITHTGLHVNVSQDKYDLISAYIKNNES